MHRMKKVNILLVDDDYEDFLITKSLVKKFKSQNYAIEWVSNYNEAIKEMTNKEYDVFLLDYYLGEKNGIDLLVKAKEIGVRKPMILLTGQGDFKNDVEAMDKGASDYLVKNQITSDTLERSIRYSITQKETSIQLQQSQDYYKAIVEDQTELICRYSASGIFTFANPAFCNFFGKELSELIGKKIKFFDIFEDDKDKVEEFLTEEIRPKAIDFIEHRVGSNVKKTHWLSWAKRGIFDENGKLTEFQIIGRNITQNKHLEHQLRQAQKMEGIGTLAGGIAHDFNNLLTIIIGNSELISIRLNKDINKTTINDSVIEIKKAATRASSLTKQLLAFSRKQLLQVKNISINSVVLNIQKMLLRLIGEDIQMNVNLEENIDLIEADPSQIEQIILNLVVNSRDAMPQGGKISISTKCVEFHNDDLNDDYKTEGKFVELRIADNGLGMDEKTQEKIFEPFFTTKDVGKGTGLGLAVAYGIVKQHKGWINVQSELYKGTEFRIYLPALEKNINADLPNTDQEIDKDDLKTKNLNILLVEDDPDLGKLAEESLQSLGYNVWLTQNYKEGMKTFLAQKEGFYDLVFSDVVLPDKSGFELVNKILSLEKVRVLLTSGYTDEKSQWESIQERNLDFIYKPYTLKELAKKLEEIFKK